MTKDELRSTGEALIAFADDKEIQYKMNGVWADSRGDLNQVLGLVSDVVCYRIKPAPAMRPIRADELPPVFMWRLDAYDMYPQAVTRGCAKTMPVSWFEVNAQKGSEFSVDGVTWKRFEVEA